MRKDLVLDLLCSSRLSTSLHPALCPGMLTLCPNSLLRSDSLTLWLWLGLVNRKYQQEERAARELWMGVSLSERCSSYQVTLWQFLLPLLAPLTSPPPLVLSDLPTPLQIVPPLNSPLLPVWVGHLSLSLSLFFCPDPNWFRGLDYPDLVMRTRNVWTRIICGMLDSDQVLSP